MFFTFFPVPNKFAPELVDKDDKPVSAFEGTIPENEGNVHLTPSLRAVDKDPSGGARKSQTSKSTVAILFLYTVESRYNVPRLQRIHRYNVLFPKSRFLL